MKIKKTREKAHGTHRLPGLRSIRLFVYISIHIFYCVKQLRPQPDSDGLCGNRISTCIFIIHKRIP